MMLQREQLRKHSPRGTRGSDRGRCDRVLVHALFQFRGRPHDRYGIGALAVLFRDPRGNFSALHLDLIRP